MSTEIAPKMSSNKRKQTTQSSSNPVRVCGFQADQLSRGEFLTFTKDIRGVWRLPQGIVELPASEDHNSYRIKFLSGQVDRDIYLNYILNDGNSIDWLLETLRSINQNEKVNFRQFKLVCGDAPHWNYAYDPLEEQKEKQEMSENNDQFEFKLLGKVSQMIIDGQVIEFRNWEGKNVSGDGKGNYRLLLEQNRAQVTAAVDWKCINWDTVKPDAQLNSNKMIEIKIGEFEFKGRKGGKKGYMNDISYYLVLDAVQLDFRFFYNQTNGEAVFNALRVTEQLPNITNVKKRKT